MTITIGKTYAVTPAAPDPNCRASGCALHRADLINPWLLYCGKKVTVTEVGHEYEGHPAVKVTYGPVDWHPRVTVRLTAEQIQALGLPPHVASTDMLMIGNVWSVSTDMPDAVIDLDDLPWGDMSQVEMPQQATEIIPVSCLQDTAVSTDVRRRQERLRRLARKQGLRLKKTRTVDGQPCWLIKDIQTQRLVGNYVGFKGMNLDEVEAYLLKQPEPQS